MNVIPQTPSLPVSVDVVLGLSNARVVDTFQALVVGWQSDDDDPVMLPVVMTDGSPFAQPLLGQFGLQFRIRREGVTVTNDDPVGRWQEEATQRAAAYRQKTMEATSGAPRGSLAAARAAREQSAA
ncbi:MAG: hypothetical protein JXA67_20395 [Micromonosporaceae bacterium]|nr:hypothetical protein [Micromonosporaceae bacterium]